MQKKIVIALLSLLFAHLHLTADESWAHKALKAMTLEEKVGQLFIAGAYPNQADALSEGQQEPCIEYIETMIRDYHIGGVLFKFYWDPLQQAQLINHYRSLSKLPLFTAQDLEWGLTQRIPSGLRFPKNLTLGAIRNNQMIYDLGREIGRQCKIIGINLNLAPVVDINSNPDNPVINDRSFGSNRENVAHKGVMFMKGLQDEGVLACAKHFPGHGDTESDSHYELPVVLHSKERLNETELFPFKQLISAGLRVIMTAHICVPALEQTANIPATLSKSIMTRLLRDELGFDGLVVTDDLLMKGISGQTSPGKVAVEAFTAGNDVLLSSRDIPANIAAIKDAIHRGIIAEEELDARVLKILLTKQWIVQQSPAEFTTPERDVHWAGLATESAKRLKSDLYAQAVTLLYNENNELPIDPGITKGIYIQIGGRGNTPLYSTLKNGIFSLPIRYLPPVSTALQRDALLNEIQDYDLAIIGLFDMNKFKKQLWGVSPETQLFLLRLQQKKTAILAVFGNPYSVSLFGARFPVVIAYEDDSDAQIMAAEIILGKKPAMGQLPIKLEGENGKN